MMSSASRSVLISFTRRSMSVGVTMPTSLPSSTTGSLWILLLLKIAAASSMGVSGVTVMQPFFMTSESWSSSNFLNTSLLDTTPMSFPSEARMTGSPVSPLRTMMLMASLRLPGTSTTMGAAVIMSATVPLI